MTERHQRPPPSTPPARDHDPSTLLPMLIGGLALITVGMIAVALIV